jgi:hypothetical protein
MPSNPYVLSQDAFRAFSDHVVSPTQTSLSRRRRLDPAIHSGLVLEQMAGSERCRDEVDVTCAA